MKTPFSIGVLIFQAIPGTMRRAFLGTMMGTDDHEQIKKHLEEAHATVQARGEANKTEVRDLLATVARTLEIGDLAGAIDALGRAGQLASPPGRFWQSLHIAAKKLGLAEKARDFEYRWAEEASLSLAQGLRRK